MESGEAMVGLGWDIRGIGEVKKELLVAGRHQANKKRRKGRRWLMVK